MKALLALVLASMPLPLMAQTAVTTETPGKTASGITFVQPKDWIASVRGTTTIFASPEGNLNVAIVEVGAASSAKDAAALAWSTYRPDAKPVLRLASPDAPSSGWDERAQLSYETPPTAKLVNSALAVRRGTLWTVMIVDGSDATASKRLAAVSLLEQSLRPQGYQRETFAGRTAHKLDAARIATLRAFLAQSIREMEVPGVGVAFIEGGKVVWEGGVGVRRLGSTAPVTAHTKFMIASNTKGMSTLLLSRLADEGKLRWDQPVTDLYPSFRLGNDATTKATLVRHLVCACTGLPRKDFSFILAAPTAPASDTFVQLAATQPTSGFGELFQYNNLMAAAAGYLGGHLAYPGMELGAAYDKAMQTRIFDPLGMRDSGFDTARAMTGDFATPHGRDVDGRVVPMSNEFNATVHPYRPAGGAWSSAADMARYVQLELSKGVGVDGKRLISETNIVERRKPGVLVGEDKYYGMGLFSETDFGVPVVTHGGTLLGFRSNFFVLPEAGVGAVLLTNADDGQALTQPFLRRILEVLYDGKPEAAAEVIALGNQARAAAKARRARLTYPGEPAVVAALAANYRNPEVGPLTIRKAGAGVSMTAGSIEGPLATRRNADGSVSIITVGPGAIGMEALIGSKGGLRTLTISDGQHDYLYTEVK